jgi:deoxycytidylate deaminase
MEHSRTRPSWDDYFIDITFQVAKRSTCDRAHVGSIIVKDRRILTTGYNGAPAGLPHCDEIGHLMISAVTACARCTQSRTPSSRLRLHGVGCRAEPST